jgi:hyperosmotically inducible protein
MKLTKTLIIVGLLAVAAPGFADKTTGQMMDDATIQAEAKAKIMSDDFFGGMGINLETRKGVVQMGGWIEDAAQGEAAAKRIAAVGGVVTVDNQLHVKPGDRSMGQSVDDGITTTRIKSAISEVDLGDGMAINIDTYAGNVLLTGFVDELADKTQAGEIAAKDKNTKKVINGIHVLK